MVLRRLYPSAARQASILLGSHRAPVLPAQLMLPKETACLVTACLVLIHSIGQLACDAASVGTSKVSAPHCSLQHVYPLILQ